MNPFEHGEVFVTEDGGETDLDLGHYERFIDENLSRRSNTTTGGVYSSNRSSSLAAAAAVTSTGARAASGLGRSSNAENRASFATA